MTSGHSSARETFGRKCPGAAKPHILENVE